MLRQAQAKAFEISAKAASMAKISELLEDFDELLEILTGSKVLTTFPFNLKRTPREPTQREKTADKVYQYLLLQEKARTPQRIQRECGLSEKDVASALGVLFCSGIITKRAGTGPTAYMVADRSHA